MQSPHLSQNQKVQEYLKKVSKLYEIDYGDFKRKLGQYTSQLESELTTADQEIKAKLQKIRVQLIFNNPGGTEKAKDIIASLF